MSDSEDDRQQQGSNEQRQRQQQQEETEMRGGGFYRPSRSGKMCGFHRPGTCCGERVPDRMLWRFQSGLAQTRLREGLSVIHIGL